MHRRELLAIMASNIVAASGSLVTDGVQRQWQYNISYDDAMRDANELLTRIEIEQPVPIPFRSKSQHHETCRCEQCDAVRDARARHRELFQLQTGNWLLVGRQGGKSIAQLEELAEKYNALRKRYAEALRGISKLEQSNRERAKTILTQAQTFKLVRGLVGEPSLTLDRAVELAMRNARAAGYTDGRRGLRF